MMDSPNVQPLPSLQGATSRQDLGTSPEGRNTALVPNGPNSAGLQGAVPPANHTGAAAGVTPGQPQEGDDRYERWIELMDRDAGERDDGDGEGREG